MAIGDGATNGSSTDVLTNLGQITIGSTVFADPVDNVTGIAAVANCSPTIFTGALNQLTGGLGCVSVGVVSAQVIGCDFASNH